MSDGLPVPPYPHLDDGLLKVITERALATLGGGGDMVSREKARAAVILAAADGWFEGHIEGEDCCPGCEYRGNVLSRRPGAPE